MNRRKFLKVMGTVAVTSAVASQAVANQKIVNTMQLGAARVEDDGRVVWKELSDSFVEQYTREVKRLSAQHKSRLRLAGCWTDENGIMRCAPEGSGACFVRADGALVCP